MSFGLPLRNGVSVGAVSTATLGYGLRASVNDFRVAMPEGSTYTRVGAGTGLTTAGLITSFAADAPQRTDRGLALEAARTNLVARFAPTAAQLSASGNVTNTTEPASPPIASQNWLVLTNTASTAFGYQIVSGVPGATTVTISCFVETADGTQPVAVNQLSASTGDFVFIVNGGVLSSATNVYTRVSGNTWRVSITGTSAAPGVDNCGFIRYLAQNQRVLKFSGWQVEVGAYSSSPIITTGATATRALPVFTETIPANRTKAFLTYADGTTTLVTGLTPAGTFDYVTPIIAANKGRFAASELVSRTWYF
jgi:hypothetical protein